jgi:hypothetical protein
MPPGEGGFINRRALCSRYDETMNILSYIIAFLTGVGSPILAGTGLGLIALRRFIAIVSSNDDW